MADDINLGFDSGLIGRERLFLMSLDLLCVAGFDGYFKQLNPAWERTLGFTIDELRSKPFIEFVHPDDREATIAECQRLMPGSYVLSFENRYLCSDGSYKWLLWSSVASTGEKLYYAVARDITDRKMTEKAINQLNEDLKASSILLEATNKELEAFSYSVSHDLRAPLRAIDGFSQALLEDYSDKLDDQGKDYLRRVRAGSQRMAQLIDDMLNLSRVTRTEMRRERVNLSDLAESITQDLTRLQPNRDVNMVVAHGVLVEGDARLLRQVLENLLGNAWKFTSKRQKATIEFGADSDHGNPVYFVRDNGAGFDMTYAHKLFGAFQRLHADAEYAGTGVGLATVQRIIHRHGGRVWAEAEIEKGSTFYFTLS